LQEVDVCAGQLPLPSQLVAPRAVPLLQLAAAHVTVGYVHAVLAPVQVPWQVPEPLHAAREPCGCPDVTVVHAPWEPATSHAWHALVHVELQQ
jgi:hypothetical protein